MLRTKRNRQAEEAAKTVSKTARGAKDRPAPTRPSDTPSKPSGPPPVAATGDERVYKANKREAQPIDTENDFRLQLLKEAMQQHEQEGTTDSELYRKLKAQYEAMTGRPPF